MIAERYITSGVHSNWSVRFITSAHVSISALSEIVTSNAEPMLKDYVDEIHPKGGLKIADKKIKKLLYRNAVW
jgi:hypothetical protein